jgi:hypothetical protein
MLLGDSEGAIALAGKDVQISIILLAVGATFIGLSPGNRSVLKVKQLSIKYKQPIRIN